LRQDPDIVMVGEIRDRETAEICIRAALTGHLVLSTLHTNDAVSAVSRLMDMGSEPFLLAATMNLIMAQRLVRRICENCSEPWNPGEDTLRHLRQRIGDSNGRKWNFRRGKGCPRCGGSGYKGRVAVYEQFVIQDTIRALISDRAPMGTLKKKAAENGLTTLFQSALMKVKDGVTTPEEAFSICSTQSELFEEEEIPRP
jgi:type II secretory ATPase GspE/PulE/Tfp pilus assembly ATPase PilB-like protein